MTVQKLTKTLIDFLGAKSRAKRDSWAALGQDPQQRMAAEESLITSRNNIDGAGEISGSHIAVLAAANQGFANPIRQRVVNQKRGWHF